MRARDVHPLIALWPSPEVLEVARLRGEAPDAQASPDECVRLVRAAFRGKRKQVRRKLRRGRR